MEKKGAAMHNPGINCRIRMCKMLFCRKEMYLMNQPLKAGCVSGLSDE